MVRELVFETGLRTTAIGIVPATCCPVSPDQTETVVRGLVLLQAVSETLRERYRLY